MSVVSPFKDMIQFTRIKILPQHMNSDIRNHMKLNLKKKVEKKCNKNGFVDEVYKIIEFKDGIMNPENLSGIVIFDISYHCRLCIPIENSIIISRVKVINQELVMTENGPIYIFVPKDNIDTNIWDVDDNFRNKNNNNKKLIENDFVKIKIINKRINQNDYQIKCIGKLLDFATNNEIEKYFV